MQRRLLCRRRRRRRRVVLAAGGDAVQCAVVRFHIQPGVVRRRNDRAAGEDLVCVLPLRRFSERDVAVSAAAFVVVDVEPYSAVVSADGVVLHPAGENLVGERTAHDEDDEAEKRIDDAEDDLERQAAVARGKEGDDPGEGEEDDDRRRFQDLRRLDARVLLVVGSDVMDDDESIDDDADERREVDVAEERDIEGGRVLDRKSTTVETVIRLR